MAQEFGVSRGTLRRALTTPIEKGLLRQVRGRGTFMTSTTIEPAIAQKRNPARTPVRCITVPVPVQARSDRLGPWQQAGSVVVRCAAGPGDRPLHCGARPAAPPAYERDHHHHRPDHDRRA
ncbi:MULTISPECIES: GntR family transcriptional regulator [Streptomyces]|uniref:GntR family transcriptional regulator n=1 Tax=Streptomyces TaxID=1883 RepID=UPI00202A3916|nr:MULTISPECIES: GntR family transcriptional regulator [Streptomyces]WUC91798.1 GntR family transcriptional regulator [Streptomyces anulatus]